MAGDCEVSPVIVKAKFENLAKELGITVSTLLTKVLLTLPVQNVTASLVDAMSEKKGLKNRMEILSSQTQEDLQLQKRTRQEYLKLAESLHLTDYSWSTLSKFFGIPFSSHQLRYDREKACEAVPMVRIGEGGGYITSIKDAILSMFDEEAKESQLELDELKKEGKLRFVFQADWGSINSRRGAIFIKLGRQDLVWVRKNYHRSPEMNALVGVLYSKETYESLKRGMKELYRQMEAMKKITIMGHEFPIEFAEVYDVKLKMEILGMKPVYFHTSIHGCPICEAKRKEYGDKSEKESKEWSDHSLQQTFQGTLEEFKEIASMDEGNPEFQISNPSNHRGFEAKIPIRTLEKLRKKGKKIEDYRTSVIAGEKGFTKKRLTEMEDKHSILHPPLTTTPLHLHFFELIHIIENIPKRCVKLCVIDLPPSSDITKRVIDCLYRITGFDLLREEKENEKEGKKKKKKKLSLWERIKKGRYNRVHWIKLLNGFFMTTNKEKNEDEEGLMEAILGSSCKDYGFDEEVWDARMDFLAITHDILREVNNATEKMNLKQANEVRSEIFKKKSFTIF